MLRIARALAILIGATSIVPYCADAANERTVNVRAFGAVGDGTADDTQAFRHAIAAAVRKGRRLRVPTGTYRVTESLECAGLTGMVFEASRSSRAIIRYEGSGYALDLMGCEGGLFEGVAVTCQSGEGGRAASRGILVGNGHGDEAGDDGGPGRYASCNTFRRLLVSGAEVGLELDGGCWMNSFYDCWFVSNDIGIYVGHAANAVDFYSTTLDNRQTQVEVFGPCYGLRFFGGTIQGAATEAAFRFVGGAEKFSCLVAGTYFENARAFEFVIDGQVRNLTVRDCYFASNSPEKQGFISFGPHAGSVSGLAFRDSFVYYPHLSTYGDLRGHQAIVDNCYALADHLQGGEVLTPGYRTPTDP